MNMTLDSKADAALSKLQDTTLTPMEEALFKAWTKANQIDKPDAPEDRVDYRGVYKHTGGAILPHGQLARFADKLNTEDKLQQVLSERMLERIQKATDSAEDVEKQKFDAERKDIDHKQKMQQGSLKLKQAPYDLKMREHDVRGKQMDIQKQQVGNEGKQIDLASALLTPERQTTQKEPNQ